MLRIVPLGSVFSPAGGTKVLRAVATVRVVVAEVAPPVATGFGENEQVTPFGRVPQLKATGCENPPTGATVSTKLADVPAGTTADGGKAAIVKSVA